MLVIKQLFTVLKRSIPLTKLVSILSSPHRKQFCYFLSVGGMACWRNGLAPNCRDAVVKVTKLFFLCLFKGQDPGLTRKYYLDLIEVLVLDFVAFTKI
jgi:hypothetical protein